MVGLCPTLQHLKMTHHSPTSPNSLPFPSLAFPRARGKVDSRFPAFRSGAASSPAADSPGEIRRARWPFRGNTRAFVTHVEPMDVYHMIGLGLCFPLDVINHRIHIHRGREGEGRGLIRSHRTIPRQKTTHRPSMNVNI